MNFGNILDEWDQLRKEERRKGPQAGGKSAAGAEARPARPHPERDAAREGMLAWMNRYGVEDKDGRGGEISRDEDDGREALAEERAHLEAMRPEACIDLHGQKLEEALLALRRFLDDAVRRGLRKVLIIHGKGNHSEGDPVLSNGVARFLEGYAAAGKRRPADKASGGKGATVLFLKPRAGER